MRFVLVAAAALAALTAAFALPAGAHVARVAAPGPQCGGTLWKLMTLSDTGKAAVKWVPTPTTIPDIAKLTRAREDHDRARHNFQKQVWKLTAVIERYRIASNGEIVLELFDIPTSTYMNAYMPSPQCLPTKARGRAQMLAARNGFLKECPAVTGQLAARSAPPPSCQASASGTRSRRRWARSKNGAELRPLIDVKITQGCGNF